MALQRRGELAGGSPPRASRKAAGESSRLALRAALQRRANVSADPREAALTPACLHNNAAERQMRPLVLGLKNYLFAGSLEVGTWAAVMRP